MMSCDQASWSCIVTAMDGSVASMFCFAAAKSYDGSALSGDVAA